VTALPTTITHLECSATGDRHDADTLHGLSTDGAPLLVRYDLERAKAAVSAGAWDDRPTDLWRWQEILPPRTTESIVSLGEPYTPLITLPTVARSLGARAPIVKDEGRLPTGSFKARGLAMAVSMAKHFGVERLAMPTNGNAGAAMAAYGTRAGMETFVFCPADTPEVNVREIALQGAHVWRVNGLIDACGSIVGAGKEEMGWFDVSTLKEPYRIEGKKTMGLELLHQLDWQVPDVIFYPTGGGTGLIGMWKGFEELEALGVIGSERPRMVAVQAAGCAPMVRAWETGARHADRWEDAHTVASGIRVPAAIGDFLILDAVRASDGFAIAVDDDHILSAQRRAAGDDGLLLCPEGAAALAGWEAAIDRGLVDRDDRAVVFNCGNGLKYPMPPADRTLPSGDVDWSTLVG
jgi:threonine synthase